MAKKSEEITITLTIRPGMSMWDAIKMRIAGDGAQVLWNALAKKITDEKQVTPNEQGQPTALTTISKEPGC